MMSDENHSCTYTYDVEEEVSGATGTITRSTESKAQESTVLERRKLIRF